MYFPSELCCTLKKTLLTIILDMVVSMVFAIILINYSSQCLCITTECYKLSVWAYITASLLLIIFILSLLCIINTFVPFKEIIFSYFLN